MNQMRPIVVLLGAMALAACASQGSTKSARDNAPQQGSSSAAVDDPQGIPTGYSRKVVDGAELFCRNDLNTGSHVARTQLCVTREQLNAQRQANQQIMQNLQGEGYTRH